MRIRDTVEYLVGGIASGVLGVAVLGAPALMVVGIWSEAYSRRGSVEGILPAPPPAIIARAIGINEADGLYLLAGVYIAGAFGLGWHYGMHTIPARYRDRNRPTMRSC